VDAFIEVSKQPGMEHVELKMAGWKGPQHEESWDEQTRKLAAAGLHGRWEYCGSIDRNEKAAFLNSLDLFCVPTVYTEPKGLFLLEAVACGVPYLQPSHGAFPEIHHRLSSLSTEPTMGRLFNPETQSDLVQGIMEAVKRGPGHYVPSQSVRNEISIELHSKRIDQLLRSNSLSH
jgi:hypothetical protein